MGKKQTYVGFDQDSASVRGVRLTRDTRKDGTHEWQLLCADEVRGDFFDNAQFALALKKIRSSLGVTTADKISVCLSGKQTYATMLDVHKLPDDEMQSMLKLELRKNMPFEASVATFDYNIVNKAKNRDGANGGEVSVIVGAVANVYLERQVAAYDKALMPPSRVDILPISIANTFWSAMSGVVSDEESQAVMHVGTTQCTLVIDGGNAPFFNRSFSFNIEDIATAYDSSDPSVLSDVTLQMNVLSSEITKSITYYKNTHRIDPISTIVVMGNCVTHDVFSAIERKTGFKILPIEKRKELITHTEIEKGKYDLAICLAMGGANVKV